MFDSQRGAVEAGSPEVRTGGPEARLPSPLPGVQDPEHGGELRCLLPHQTGRSGSDPSTVQQVGSRATHQNKNTHPVQTDLASTRLERNDLVLSRFLSTVAVNSSF